ncbi:hypothetical protein [Nitrosomonas sp.]|uniref:hypothetical protein n=1 Tax=Nitrosomonas sp. TaxID=42353 RepID=UPI001D2B5B1F|nr:hypothetical protein [Nitrosomonas sp.]MCB1949641.1 hypothetical protein [Nitrosomonas sp.]
MNNTYPLKKVLVILLMGVVCLMTAIVSIFGFYVYGREIILSIGSNDKSLLFWYLPFLFAAIIALPVAIRTGQSVYKRIKELKSAHRY